MRGDRHETLSPVVRTRLKTTDDGFDSSDSESDKTAGSCNYIQEYSGPIQGGYFDPIGDTGFLIKTTPYGAGSNESVGH